MTNDTTHLIVGASLAGAKAAETLREEGFDGPLVMVGAERELPYERPPLSKDYLLGKAEREHGLRPSAALVCRARRRPASRRGGHRSTRPRTR